MADKKLTELTNYTPPIDTDILPIVDITTSTTKKITWANVKAALKTYFDTQYPTLNVAARAYLSADQDNIAGGGAGYYQINLDSESYDIGGNFASYCFTTPVAGYYLVTGQVTFEGADMSAGNYSADIYVDPAGAGALAVVAENFNYFATAAKYVCIPVTDIIYCTAGDKIYLYCSTADTDVDIESGAAYTFMSVVLLGV